MNRLNARVYSHPQKKGIAITELWLSGTTSGDRIIANAEHVRTEEQSALERAAVHVSRWAMEYGCALPIRHPTLRRIRTDG